MEPVVGLVIATFGIVVSGAAEVVADDSVDTVPIFPAASTAATL